jgi:signal transduction histidine kinase
MIRKPTYEELEQTLAHLMGELEAVSKQTGELKRSFLSMISHEMRTPLHAILGLAEIMATTDLTQEEKEEYVTQINQCGNNLLQVVQNMIDAAMLEAGDIKLSASACVVSDLMDEVYQYFNLEKRRQDKWAIALLKSVSLPSDDFVIINDRERLKQVLGNLLDNALKFTERGVIELGCYIPQEQIIRFFVKIAVQVQTPEMCSRFSDCLQNPLRQRRSCSTVPVLD